MLLNQIGKTPTTTKKSTRNQPNEDACRSRSTSVSAVGFLVLTSTLAHKTAPRRQTPTRGYALASTIRKVLFCSSLPPRTPSNKNGWNQHEQKQRHQLHLSRSLPVLGSWSVLGCYSIREPPPSGELQNSPGSSPPGVDFLGYVHVNVGMAWRSRLPYHGYFMY